MALVHRLTTPSYLGGLPATHDYVNDPAANGDPGAAAPADGKKAAGPNEGTYFVAFGEDGTSSDFNRGHQAHAQSADFFDDTISGEVPVPSTVDGTAGAALTSLVVTGSVFVGKQGTTDTQDNRNRLIKILNADTGNDLLGAAAAIVVVTLIHDGANNNKVGVPASGFFTNPTLTIAPAIPMGTNYRIVFGKQSKLSSIVRSKTDLDAFVREAIRGSANTSGEVLRFINQASRLVAGNVAALAATIIETPGLGGNLLPTSNALTIDVDPSDDFAFGGQFKVRFNRDFTSSTLFSVNEDAGPGQSNWSNPAERISLADPNIIGAGFTIPRVDVSSSLVVEGDQHLRLAEVDPVAEPSSLLKAANARLLTCGDGTVSFGDFNGPMAIIDAIAFINANPLTGTARIVVKAGNYTANNNVIAGAGIASGIAIEGESSTGVIITNNATAGQFGFNIQTSNVLLRNLNFANGGNGSLVGVKVLGSRAVLERCIFTDQSLVYNPSGGQSEALRVRDSRIDCTNIAAACFELEVGIPLTLGVSGVIFSDCALTAAYHHPAILLRDLGAVIATPIDGWLFERCNIQLGSTTVTMAGNLTGNCGVFDNVLASSGKIEVDIEFRDCNVTTAFGTANVLLYLRTAVGANLITYRRFAIHGGTWILPSTSAILPFYLGGELFTDFSFISLVEIEKVRWGYAAALGAVSYGAPTTECGAPSASTFGAFFIAATDLRMRAVRWISATAKSDSADFYPFIYRNWDVDGVFIADTWFDNGPGITPQARVHLESGSNGRGSGVVKNFVVDGGLSAATAAVAGNVTGGVFTLAANGHLWLEDCVVRNLSGAHDGFNLLNIPSPQGLRLTRCEAIEVGGNGFWFDHNGQVGSDTPKDITIRDCFFGACGQVGLYVHGQATQPNSKPFINLLLDGNTVSECVAEGIIVGTGRASSSVENTILVVDNKVYNNNGSTPIQMRIGYGGSELGTLTAVVLRGNVCRDTTLTRGSIHFTSSGGNPLPTPSTSAETGYVGLPFITTGDRVWANGATMMHNDAKLAI